MVAWRAGTTSRRAAACYDAAVFSGVSFGGCCRSRDAQAPCPVIIAAARWRLAPLRRLAIAALICCGLARSVEAHPAPFSYVDLRLGAAGLDVSLTAHDIDLAHELGALEPSRLRDPAFVDASRARLVAVILERLRVSADGVRLVLTPGRVDVAGERDAVTFTFSAPWTQRAGVLGAHAVLFPYDATHQTFLNVYEDGELRRQEILSASRPATEFFSGSTQGVLAVVRRFAASGVEHIFGGPDHIAFIVGLLLLGGSLRRLLIVMTAFTLAHSITLSLAALELLTPPARYVEPAIALSIVYVGVDNFLVTSASRDVRSWIAFAFGLIHGFGFASVLKEFGLPTTALGWALFSFNVGVEVGQAAIVLAIAPAVAWLHRTRPAAGRAVALTGSALVVAAGAYWFVERTFGWVWMG